MRSRELEEELSRTKEQLQTALDTAQSAIDETRSNTEEYQTVNEELQSSNEELVTLNDELLHHNIELNALTQDLTNLLLGVDIPVLVLDAALRVRRFSPVALRALEEYGWPGNVRELENVVQRAVVMADGPTVELWHLPKAFCNELEQQQAERSYDGEVREFKRRLILRALRDCGGSKSEAARRLGIARGYLHRLINQLHIEEGPLESAANAPEVGTQVM